MDKYTRGKVYRIICNKTGLTYYGSTTQNNLSQRLAEHRSDYKRFKEGKSKKVVHPFK